MKTRTIAYTGLMTALTTLATTYLSVKLPANGYFNLGDAIIFITAFLFGPIPAMISGGLGSALADIILAFPIYAPFTFIVKGFEGLLCGILIVKVFKRKNIGLSVLSTLVCGLWMVFGYMLSDWILLKSFTNALVGVPQNLLQASASIILANIFIFVFIKNKKRLKFLNININDKNAKTNKKILSQQKENIEDDYIYDKFKTKNINETNSNDNDCDSSK